VQADGIESKVGEITEIIRNQFTEQHLKDALNQLATQFTENRRELPQDGSLTDADRIRTLSLGEHMEVRGGNWNVEDDGNHVTVRVDTGKEFYFPSRVKPLITFIAREERFRVGDFPHVFSDESKKVFARHLVEKGLLTFANESSPGVETTPEPGETAEFSGSVHDAKSNGQSRE
jgi:hypothetical protein